jgi:hypothetical protein
MWGLAWPFAWVVRKTLMKKDRVREIIFLMGYFCKTNSRSVRFLE